MSSDIAHVSLTPGPPLAGTCDLCATPATSLVAALFVQHERGGAVQFATCERCTIALRRLAAVTGGRARFTVTPVVGSTHRPEPLPEDESATVPGTALPVLIQERAERLRDTDGRAYVVRLYGEPRPDGTWVGWAQFVAVDGTAILRTSPETTQSSRDQVAYWASGLEPLYFEGAFRRAQPAAAPA